MPCFCWYYDLEYDRCDGRVLGETQAGQGGYAGGYSRAGVYVYLASRQAISSPSSQSRPGHGLVSCPVAMCTALPLLMLIVLVGCDAAASKPSRPASAGKRAGIEALRAVAARYVVFLLLICR